MENLSSYRIFHAVASCENISKASEELYISQPAISKSIQKLESSLHTKLFLRGHRGVTLTAEGTILYERTKQAFQALTQAEELITIRKQKGIGELRLGASTTLSKYILLPHLKEFIRLHPNVKISIRCQSTFETVHLLEEGKIDIGLTGKIDTPPHCAFQKYSDIQDTFVSTQEYLNSLQESTSEHQHILQESNLMLLDEKNISRLYIDQYFHLNQIEHKQVLEISTMDLLIEFAKIGLGVACVIKEFVQKELSQKQLVEIELPEPIEKRAVGFAYQTNGLNHDSVLKFLELLRK